MTSGTHGTAAGTPYHRALAGAVLHSHSRRYRLARSIGVHIRTLRRWISGDTTPTVKEWIDAVKACGIEPSTALLLAEVGLERLIGSPYQIYVDRFMRDFFSTMNLEALDEIDFDPRAAARDAMLIRNAWQQDTRRRQQFVDTLYRTDDNLR